VAFAADQIALAVAEIGAIAQRRVALMVDPTLSFDLPPFLTPEPGLNSGLMIAEVTSAALMSENKHLANPCSTDSTPTSANQEDHVSMAAHGARRLLQMTENLFRHRRHRGDLRRAGHRTCARRSSPPSPLAAAMARPRGSVPRSSRGSLHGARSQGRGARAFGALAAPRPPPAAWRSDAGMRSRSKSFAATARSCSVCRIPERMCPTIASFG
jgi:hypothetical protein